MWRTSHKMERQRSLRRLSKSASAPLLPELSPALGPFIKAPTVSPARRRHTRIAIAFLSVFLSLHFLTTFLAGEPQFDIPYGITRSQQLNDNDLYPLSAALLFKPQPQRSGPRRIPRIIHQLYNSSEPDLSKASAAFNALQTANPGWELRFYDANDWSVHVSRWFPEYEDAYEQLKSDTERRNFFGYLAVLQHGGVFLDEPGLTAQWEPLMVDRTDYGGALRPLSSVLRPDDAFVAVWDTEFASAQAAVNSCYVRARQIKHQVFAAAPGHPVLKEICDRIVSTLSTRFSSHPTIDSLERTGPGVFTDVVLNYAAESTPVRRKPGDRMRLLPRHAFGGSTTGTGKEKCDLLTNGAESEPVPQQLKVTATSARSPQRLSRWQRLARVVDTLLFLRTEDRTRDDLSRDTVSKLDEWMWANRPDVAVAAHVDRIAAQHEERQLFPVSADFEPPFDVMTHLMTHGERQSGWDVSLALSSYGTWQPSVQPTRRPSLADALVGSLGSTSLDSAHDLGGMNDFNRSLIASRSRGVLVDVGAGYGFISLAAAARGHRVHAFELGPGSLEAFEASIERNGFGHLVSVHKVPLGASSQRGPACLELRPSARAAAEDSASVATLPADVELARGYSDPDAHAVGAKNCARTAMRMPGAEALPIGRGEPVAGLRVSANGWEGFLMEGFVPVIEQDRPPVIAVEWNPDAMRAVGYADPMRLLHMLNDLGYTDVSHSGFICDERWYSITYGVRRRGGVRPEDRSGLRQPTWCRLAQEDYYLLLDKANAKYPETLLFVNMMAGAQRKREDASVMEGLSPGQLVDDPSIAVKEVTALEANAL